MNSMDYVEDQLIKKQAPNLRPGDRVRVHMKIKEGEKKRIQVFEGVVISIRRGKSNATFTVRKISFGYGVERIFPTHSPLIAKVEVVRSGRVRRAKLYYLRSRRGKAARLKEGKRIEPGRPQPPANAQPAESEESRESSS